MGKWKLILGHYQALTDQVMSHELYIVLHRTIDAHLTSNQLSGDMLVLICF
jgi:hypothetical protein